MLDARHGRAPTRSALYGAKIIPPNIAEILDEFGIQKVNYFADNDDPGKQGAAILLRLLLAAGWGGEAEFRQFKGEGIPKKGDANDLLCHHYPDMAAARAALDALPTFVPDIQPKNGRKPSHLPDVGSN